MKCPRCSAENRIDALYCHECGAELEHGLSDVQAAVDRERRTERAKAAARTVRWLWAASIVLLVAGYSFRSAYKDLPGNDIVAFASPPTVEIDQRVTVADDGFIAKFADHFGVKLPAPKQVPVPKAPKDDPGLATGLHEAALRRAAIAISQSGRREPIKGLLVGDLVLEVPDPERQGATRRVHIADVRRLVPQADGRWQVHARGLRAPVAATIPDAHNVRLHLLPLEGGPPRNLALANVAAIGPLQEE